MQQPAAPGLRAAGGRRKLLATSTAPPAVTAPGQRAAGHRRELLTTSTATCSAGTWPAR
ncbi:hypothetical protein [Achromobacter ruhlandii]|uniref:hypothetical protein n=1 Tax=Achromobacter ruhlandii TaxID=72557 RepID=UPI000ADF56ED|nr:hypothetical protein [Achromobacter ruhlandii]